MMRVGTLLAGGAFLGGGGSVSALSLAAILATGESQALALDFTDDFWNASTSRYGSAYIVDTTTPANDYDSIPGSLLTYTAPSVKMCMQADGYLKFGPHNLYLNSAAPANQSVTVVSGATYAITITGTVSITWSGAYAATQTAGTATFTAASGTLTGGSTSGSGTVHVYRTPAVSTYLATAGSQVFELPYEWDSSGNPLGIRVEEARTNLWYPSNPLTAATNYVTQSVGITGSDGSNTSTKLTETTDNGAHHVGDGVGQFIAATNGVAYTLSAIVAKGTRSHCWLGGYFPSTGVIDFRAYFNLDTGSWGTVSAGITTHTPEVLANGFYRIACTITSTATETVYPRVGLASADNTSYYIGTTSEYMYAEYVMVEAGSFPTSPIATTSSTVTRAADNISLATSAFPNDSDGPITWFAKVYNVLGSRIVGMEVAEGPLMRNNNTQVLAFQDPDAFIANAGSGGFAGSVAKVAFSTDGTTGYLCFNAGSVGSSLFPYSMVGPTMRLGSEGGASNFMNGHFQQLLMIPRQESGAELQTRTTL